MIALGPVAIALTASLVQATGNIRGVDHERMLNDSLLRKAIRLEDYDAELVASGAEPLRNRLDLEREDEDFSLPTFMKENTLTKQRRMKNYYDDGNDDYAEDDYLSNNKYTFSGYALKYASCQKVQRFSPQAVQRGEYSSMITDDIVVLRLCPNNKCNSNYQYGCGSGYGEYVIDVADYMTIVMKYKSHKQQNLCDFCTSCEKAGYYFESDDVDNGDDVDDGAYYGDDGRLLASSRYCYQYSDECSTCSQTDDGNYGYGETSYLDYLNYIGCAQVNNNGNSFYYNPYCDPDSGNVVMGAYYDNYCSQFAGDAIDVSDFAGVDFESESFLDAPLMSCVECSSTNYPPYYNADNSFCNNVYENSGKCDASLSYELETAYDDGDDGYYSNYYGSNVTDEEVQCDFIESIRHGTYDNYGEIYVSSSQQTNQEATVTQGQTISLALLSTICVGLALYSCFLHHEMTNLLLKSLSSGLMETKRKQYRARNRSKAESYSATFSSDTDGASTLDGDDSSTVASTK